MYLNLLEASILVANQLQPDHCNLLLLLLIVINYLFIVCNIILSQEIEVYSDRKRSFLAKYSLYLKLLYLKENVQYDIIK